MKSDCDPLELDTNIEYVPGADVASVATKVVAEADVIVSGTNTPEDEPIATPDCGSKFFPSIAIVGVAVFNPLTVALEMDNSFAA